MSTRNKKKKRFPPGLIVSIVIVTGIAASYMLHLPPVSWIQEFIDQAPENPDTGLAAKSFPEKKPFRFGSRALAGVCDEYGLDIDSVVEDLEAFAIDAKPEWSIKRIAAENDMEQESLFEVLRELSRDR